MRRLGASWEPNMTQHIERDLEKHLQSISAEFHATKNRIRHLIGSTHWLSDGEAKEAIFRRILTTYIAESVHVGSGFICYPNPARSYHDERNTSTQIDVLVTSRDKPTLYKERDLIIVTPDAVKAIVEVKTRRTLPEIREDIEKLANNIRRTRESASCREHWAGLFIYEPLVASTVNIYQEVLTVLQEVTQGNPLSVINCIAIGENVFIRFWQDGNDVDSLAGPVWHSYDLSRLAQGYFLGNLIWAVSPSNPATQYIWFPAENGKESRRRYYCGLKGTATIFPEYARSLNP